MIAKAEIASIPAILRVEVLTRPCLRPCSAVRFVHDMLDGLRQGLVRFPRRRRTISVRGIVE